MIEFSIAFIILVFSSNVSCTLTTFEDYVFENDTKITAHSWTFDLTVKDPEWNSPPDGIILSYQYYHVNDSYPVNYISPVDILIASGKVAKNPDKYNFTYSWGGRYVNLSFVAPITEVASIVSSIGNIHCIARTRDALNSLKEIQLGDKMVLSGYLVDVTGWNTSNTLYWMTDTEFGNEDCEIIVISDVIPVHISDIDLWTMLVLLFAVIAVIIGIAYIYWNQRRECITGLKKINL